MSANDPMNAENQKTDSSENSGVGDIDINRSRLAAAFASNNSLLAGEDIVPNIGGDLPLDAPQLISEDEGGNNYRTKSATTDAGKPPIQPRNFDNKAIGVTHPNHHRATSTGDHSFMSALTEPDDVNGSAGKAPTNNLSFDQNTKPPSPTKKQQTAPPKKVFGKVDLQDVLGLNPMESEAENAILKAVEMAQAQARQNATRHKRVGTAGSSLLPSIPDDVVAAFMDNEEEDEHERKPLQDLTFPQESTSPGGTATSPKSHLPPLRPRLGSSGNGASYMSRRSRISQQASKRSVVQGDNNSVKTGGTTTVATAAPKYVSTEDKLFGVTEQWKDLHAAQEAAPGPSEFDIPVPDLRADTRANAQDLLIQNANILFRRSVKKGGDKGPTATGHSDVIQEDSVRQDVETGGLGSSDEDNPTPTAGNQKGRRHLLFGRKQTTDNNGALGIRLLGSLKHGGQMAGAELKQSFDYIHDYLKPKVGSLMKSLRMTAMYVFLPALALSVALYYAGNPLMCSSTNDFIPKKTDDSNSTKTNSADESLEGDDPTCAAVSWFIIFLVIRQGVTFGLAKCWEVLFIDLLSVRSRRMVKLVGPMFTLLIVQSKGWPFILAFWCLFDFFLLYGDGQFANHWLFWQNIIPWFNQDNPSGTITSHSFYEGILISGLIIGVSVSVKRLWMGIYLGKRTYTNYGKDLAKCMNDMLLISTVGALAREIEVESNGQDQKRLTHSGFEGAINKDSILQMWEDNDDSDTETQDEEAKEQLSARSPSRTPPRKLRTASNVSEISKGSPRSAEGSPQRTNAEDGTQQPRSPLRTTEPPLYESTHFKSRKLMAEKLLGAWDEPKRYREKNQKITISSILAFRQALEFMDDLFPFSVTFGLANTREACIESSQEVYKRLLLHTPGTYLLPFSTIALAAIDENVNIEQKKLKQLRKLFIPDKEGFLTPLDFVKSVDGVYKSLRMLRASIQNSTQIDEAFERIFNAVFYLLLGCIVLSSLGFDPFSLFLSLSSIILSASFMIGSASAKYFEGILLIFARRPYDIGDRISLSDPKDNTDAGGSSAWFVENVNLYATTVRYATTNEVATYSNGSLASLRIINAKRSPLAIKFVNVKFGVDVPYSKVEIFKASVETFIKERPKEWVSMMAFRATRVEADLGYIEYKIVAQHVEGWQNIGPILNSTAELNQYCLEVSKQLGMRYSAPPLPVHLDLARQNLLQQLMSGNNNEASGDESAPSASKIGLAVPDGL